jgi:hypothetical protein
MAETTTSAAPGPADAELFTIKGGTALTIEAREFKVSEENLATSPASIREGRVKTKLLEAVVTDVVDPGPYNVSKTGRINWDEVLEGDRDVLLKALRSATWGPDYFRDDNCPLCQQATENWFNLDAFPVQELPESSLEHVKTGKPIECVLPRSKRRVLFRLRRGKDERELRKIRDFREEEIPQALLELQVISVEGVGPGDALKDFLQNLPGLDSSFLRKAMDKANCGVDQKGIWRCKCGHRWTKDVDFTTDFFFPEYREKNA